MLQPKDTDWLNGYKNKICLHAVYQRPTSDLGKHTERKWCYYCCSDAKACLTLWDPMNFSTPGFPVLQYLLEFVQTHVHWFCDAIQPSHPLTPFSSCPQCFSALGSFPVSQPFTSGGQSIGASVSASVLPMNTQGWFSLGLTGLISLLSKGCPRVFPSTTVWKHQFFSTQPS